MGLNIFEFIKKLKKNEDENPFLQKHVIDRNLEPINSCRQCHNLFGDNYSNIIIQDNDSHITKVICKSCGNVHYFRNWKPHKSQ